MRSKRFSATSESARMLVRLSKAFLPPHLTGAFFARIKGTMRYGQGMAGRLLAKLLDGTPMTLTELKREGLWREELVAHLNQELRPTGRVIRHKRVCGLCNQTVFWLSHPQPGSRATSSSS